MTAEEIQAAITANNQRRVVLDDEIAARKRQLYDLNREHEALERQFHEATRPQKKSGEPSAEGSAQGQGVVAGVLVQ